MPRAFPDKSPWPVGSPRPEGYIAFFDWAAAQHRGGLRQRQCPTCRLWKFPQERCGCKADGSDEHGKG
jgi:hypothetical protein